jgi:CBS domain-containing protein
MKGLAMTTYIDRNVLNRFDRWAMRVSDLTMSNPLSIRADATIREAIAFLAARGAKAALVANEAGRPIGVFGLADLVGAIRDHDADASTVFNMQTSDLMTPFVSVVSADTPVQGVVDELLDCKVDHVYVADDTGVIVGAVGIEDLIRHLHESTAEAAELDCTTAS